MFAEIKHVLLLLNTLILNLLLLATGVFLTSESALVNKEL